MGGWGDGGRTVSCIHSYSVPSSHLANRYACLLTIYTSRQWIRTNETLFVDVLTAKAVAITLLNES